MAKHHKGSKKQSKAIAIVTPAPVVKPEPPKPAVKHTALTAKETYEFRMMQMIDSLESTREDIDHLLHSHFVSDLCIGIVGCGLLYLLVMVAQRIV